MAYLPVETVIKSRQDEYYQAFREADEVTDCSHFIKFLLQALSDSLNEAINVSEMRVEMKVKTRVKTAGKILHLLAEGSNLSLMEIAEHLSVAKSTVERSVAKLKKEGKLSYVDSLFTTTMFLMIFACLCTSSNEELPRLSDNFAD